MRTLTRLSRRAYSSTSCRSNDLRLVHQHLSKHNLTPYADAETLQETYRAQHLLFKSDPSSSPSSSPPPPYLISFESEPIYTFGRQQKAAPSSSSSSSPSPSPSTSPLLEPLAVHLPQRQSPIQRTFTPKVSFTQRGGLTTYHGPGQLVLWPVLDIHSPRYAHFSVSSYAGFLEATTRRLLREVFGIETYISPDEPGVWVRGENGQIEGRPRKIAALGVHHRRYVTALGTAINVDVATEGGQEVNPWARFVPCGIEDKSVTSVVREMGPRAEGEGMVFDMGELARRWAGMFEEGLLDEGKRGLSER